jgi:hypothetical protein
MYKYLWEPGQKVLLAGMNTGTVTVEHPTGNGYYLY